LIILIAKEIFKKKLLLYYTDKLLLYYTVLDPTELTKLRKTKSLIFEGVFVSTRDCSKSINFGRALETHWKLRSIKEHLVHTNQAPRGSMDSSGLPAAEIL
jgi:hypothetical protein